MQSLLSCSCQIANVVIPNNRKLWARKAEPWQACSAVVYAAQLLRAIALYVNVHLPAPIPFEALSSESMGRYVRCYIYVANHYWNDCNELTWLVTRKYDVSFLESIFSLLWCVKNIKDFVEIWCALGWVFLLPPCLKWLIKVVYSLFPLL